jgi:hypothetical protein
LELLLIFVYRLTDADEVDIPFNNKVGTKRYMAPEVRDTTLITEYLDFYCFCLVTEKFVCI